MAGDDLVKSGAGASATDVFGTVAKEPARKEQEPAQVAARWVAPSSAPVENVSSGGFTQLLRALNDDTVKEAPAAAPVESKAVVSVAVAGPMTQLLRTIGAPAAESSVVEKPVAPASSSQVTSFLPQSAPVIPAASAPPAVAAGSFTQLFQRLDAEPVAEPIKEAVPMRPREASYPSTPLPAAPVTPAVLLDRGEPPAVPVSFTQMFAGVTADAGLGMNVAVAEAPIKTIEAVPAPLTAEAVPASEGHAPVSSAWGVPGSFTQMFQALDAPQEEPVLYEASPVAVETHPAPKRTVEPVAGVARMEAPTEAPVSTPGPFTRMFQTLDAPPAETANVPVRAVAADVAPAEAKREVSVSPPGSFTQMFQALDAPADEPVRHETTPVRVEPGMSAPGSFTQMFRMLGEEPQSAKEAGAGTGSFTQLLGHPTSSSVPVVPPSPSSFERPFAASASAREESGASQMFATYKEAAPSSSEHAPGFSPVEALPMGRSPLGSTPSSGGLTQLLRALDQTTATPKPYAALNDSPSVAPASAAGSFTGVYGELGTSASAAAPIAPMAGTQTEVATGPSEFTRMINASAAREAALRGGGDTTAPGAASVSPAGAPAPGAGFAMPGGLSPMPLASFGAPAAPQASVSGPGGAHGAVSAAGGGQASFAAPKMPSTPPMKMPEVPKAAGTPAGIQKYVPLLLILVIFLLLAILVAVVVLMKK